MAKEGKLCFGAADDADDAPMMGKRHHRRKKYLLLLYFFYLADDADDRKDKAGNRIKYIREGEGNIIGNHCVQRGRRILGVGDAIPGFL